MTNMKPEARKTSRFGYKAVIRHTTDTRSSSDGRTEIVSFTMPTREAALERAQQIIDARIWHHARKTREVAERRQRYAEQRRDP